MQHASSSSGGTGGVTRLARRFLASWLLMAVTCLPVAAQTTDSMLIAWTSSATGGSLHFEWKISSTWSETNTVDEITGFDVWVNGQKVDGTNATTQHYELYGLANNTAFTFQVNAVFTTKSTASPLLSHQLSASTSDRSKPGVTDSPVLLTVTGGFIRVRVLPPSDTGGADLLNVTVVVRREDDLSVTSLRSHGLQDSDFTLFEFYGLDALTAYVLSAFAITVDGSTSLESDRLTVMTKALQLAGPCPAPTVLNVTGASVVLRLNPSLDDGGARIKGYNVYMATNDTSDFTAIATTVDSAVMDVVEILHSTELKDEPLLPETRYLFKAVAVTLVDICISVSSSLQTANSTTAWTAAASAPDAPPAPYFLGATGGTISMSLAKPPNMQGSVLVGFSITISKSGQTVVDFKATNDSVNYDANFLEANSTYFVKVAVITDLGNSTWSDSTVVSTSTPTTPTAPRNVTVTNITGSSAVLQWSVPFDSGGTDITDYTIRLISPGMQEERPASLSPTLITDLVSDTNYTAKIAATNAVGKKSSWLRTAGVSFETLPSIPPSEPWGIASVFSSGGGIEVQWKPPVERGGTLVSTMAYNVTMFSIASCFDNSTLHPCSQCNAVQLLAVKKYELTANASVCERPATQCPDGTFECCLTRGDSEYGFGLQCHAMITARRSMTVVGTTALIFQGLKYSSTYYFGVQARNRAGISALSTIVGLRTTSQTTPGFPRTLRQLAATGGSVQLAWNPPLDTGGGLIVGYRVYRDYELLTPRYVLPPYTDCGGLTAETQYVYGVTAVNGSLEEGTMTSTVMTTSAVSIPSPPSLSLTSRTVSWLSDIAGYVLTMNSSDGTKFDLGIVDTSNLTSTANELNASTKYEFLIKTSTTAFPADENDASYAQIAVWSTIGTVPEPPPPVELLGQPHAGTLTVSIELPLDTGGLPLIDYALYMRIFPTPTTANIDLNTESELPFAVVCDTFSLMVENAQRICIVNRLLADTSYELFATCTNPMGGSLPGARTVFKTATAIELPSAPLNLRTSSVSSGNVNLEWDLPFDFGGSADIIGYIVYQKFNYLSDAYFTVYDGQDSPTRNVEVRGLMRNATYAFAVVALNAASFCEDPDSYKLSPFLIVPTLTYSRLSPPVQPFTVSRTGGSITIGWSAPNDLAGIDLRGYSVELLDLNANTSDVLTPWFLGSEETTYTHYGLSESTSYSYCVSAVNNDGFSERSAILTTSTAVSSPPGPVGSFRAFSMSGGSITLAWDLPLDTGGRDIIRYEITRVGNGDSFATIDTIFDDHYGLNALTVYQYQIRAYNGLFKGSTNSCSVVTGSPSLPEPLLFRTVIPYGGRLEVAWDIPEDSGGISLTGYLITLLDATQSTIIAQLQTNATFQTIWGLHSYTGYYLTGKSMNNQGESDLVGFSVATGPPDAPGAPPPPVATGIHGGSVDISAQMPNYTGGENVTMVLYKGKTQVHVFPADESTVTIYGLVAETTYVFSASARNSRGELMSLGLTLTTTVISTPGQVLNIQVEDVTVDQIALTWDIAQDTGGDDRLQYQVTFFKSTAEGVQETSEQQQLATSNMALLSGLQYSSYYTVTVAAITRTSLLGVASAPQLALTEQPLTGVMVGSSSDVFVQENAGLISLSIIRVNGSFGDISFSFATVSESAVEGVNYERNTGTRTLPTSIKSDIIDIVIFNDTIYNPNISFRVVITDMTTMLQSATRVFLMDDGDAGAITFSSPATTALENSGTTWLRMTRMGGLSPMAVVQFVIIQNASVMDRFHLLQPTLTFGEGVKELNLSVQMVDDLNFQYAPDSITISFDILEGGVQYGTYRSLTLTAVDDGDISIPKQCSEVERVSVTGGALGLQWTPPMDRGGSNVTLQYLLDFMVDGNVVISHAAVTESETVYGLNESTTYSVSIRAVNSAGPGLPTAPLLLATLMATSVTTPRNIQVLATSSSSALISWDPPLDNGGSKIVAYTIFNVSGSDTLTPFSAVQCSVATICVIKQLLALTTYNTRIQASTAFVTNGLFSDIVQFNTSNPDIPDTPPELNVSWVSAGAMAVQMFDPVNIGGSYIQQYRLFIRADNDLDFTLVYDGKLPEYTVYRLRRETMYWVKYQVANSVGFSLPSPLKSQETLGKSLPGPPVDVSLADRTGGAITLTWSEPLDVAGRDISGYTVLVYPDDSDMSSFVGYDGKWVPTREGTVYGLTADTTYGMEVLAYSDVSNCFDPSLQASSAMISVSTSNATPPISPELIVGRHTGGIIELVWTTPKDKGGIPLTGFQLFAINFNGTGNSRTLFSTNDTSVLSFTDSNLTAATDYSYAIRASNAVGYSSNSSILTTVTDLATPPSAPLNVRQLSYKTGGAVEIGWDQPFDTGGQPIAGYMIYRNGELLNGGLPSTARTFIDKSRLVANTGYAFTVRAISASLVTSEASEVGIASTATATKPQKLLSLTANPGSSFLNVTWILDGDTGGLPVTRYEVWLMRGSTLIANYSVTGSYSIFTGLTAQTVYNCSARVYNDMGSSETLTVNLTTINVSLPSNPDPPLVVAVFGGNITIELEPPLYTGGSSITAMKVYEHNIGGEVTVPLSIGVPGSYTFVGVTAESDYSITCSAINIVGEGPQSMAVSIRTTPINKPGPILVAPVLDAATGVSLSVEWTPPVDTGGSQSLTYEIRVVDAAGGIITNPSVKLAFTIAQLAYNSTYFISVRASNNAGTGGWSPVLSATTQPDAAGEFSFVQSSTSVLENATKVALEVQRVSGLNGRVTVSYIAEPSGSRPVDIGSDYAVVQGSNVTTGTIVFENQQNQRSIVIQIINDAVFEYPDETFSIRLSAVSGTAKLGANQAVTVTIVDDGDAGYVSFEKPNYSFSEATTSAVVSIIREYGSSGRITLQFEYSGGSATIGYDFRKSVDPVIMEEGVTRANLTFSIINDKIFEFPDEYFFIRMLIESGGAKAGQTLAQITILDDGDVSAPGACPPLQLLSRTGGLATFALDLPAHNGSGTGAISNLVVRLSSATSSVDLKNAVDSVLSVGNLTALTAYNISVAVNSSAGLGLFSNLTAFSTTEASLPGATASMSVTSSTGGSVSLSWSSPYDTGGVPITKYRVDVLDFDGIQQIAAENQQPSTTATVYGLTASTSYVFFVQAGNAVITSGTEDGWGTTSVSFTFSTTPLTLPDPLNLHPDHYRSPTGGKVVLSWDAPKDNGGSEIDAYTIYTRSSLRPWYQAERSVAASGLFASASALNASTSYEFFVLAENSLLSVELPGKLTISKGTRLLRSSVDLSRWLSTGSVIALQGAFFVVRNASNAAAGSISARYIHSTASIVEQQGHLIGQATSFTVLNTTSPTLPELPPIPTLVASTGGMLNILLQSPKDTGGIPILAFAVFWNGQKLDAEGYLESPSQISYLSLTTLISVPHLKPLENYNVSVVAINSFSLCYFGRAITSQEATFRTTNYSAPASPRLVTLRTTGGGITLNMIDPYDTGGQGIRIYRLYSKRNGTTEPWSLAYEGSTHQATVARLTSLTEYSFMASVNNGIFDSANSSVKVVKTTSNSAPGACVPVSLVIATGGMMQVSWDYPPDNGGSVITSFYVTIASGLDGSGRITVLTKLLTYTFYRLIAESEYNVVVRAINIMGVGPESSSAIFTTAAESPPVGEIEVAILESTGGAAAISFAEPTDLGGVESSDMVYQIYLDQENVRNLTYSSLQDNIVNSGNARRLKQSNSRRLDVSTTVFSNVLIGDMDPKTLYGIQVRPMNVNNSGELSAAFPVETRDPTIPSSPFELAIEGVTGGLISLSWKPPLDSGGIPLSGYVLHWTNSNDGPIVETSHSNLSETTLYLLSPNRAYWVSVTAWNEIGESQASETLQVSTRSVTPPSSPREFAIQSVSFDSIACNWTTPQDLGGDIIASYSVTATETTDPMVSVTLTVVLPSAQFQGLSSSTAYSISVVALNSFGDSSSASSTRYATTSAGVNIPSVPRIGCVSPDSIELYWYPYPGATGYRVLRNGSEISEIISGTSITDTEGLVSESVYEYTVLAVVDGVFGVASTAATVATMNSTESGICEGDFGRVHQLDYPDKANKRWLIAPTVPYSQITLTFTLFDLECDHDYVEILDAISEEKLWKGGCSRLGHFVYQADASIFLQFTSDDSVTKKGFDVYYQTDGSTESTTIPSPGENSVCSSHGRSQRDGRCKCSVGFTGEACNNRLVCCSDPLRCHHVVCDMDPSHVIVVSNEFGDDTQGTGQMMDAFEGGTAPKAVQTLQRAINLSTDGSFIFVYPGAYSGVANRDLEIQAVNLTIVTMKGSVWTSVDCSNSSRFVSSTDSNLAIQGFTLKNCKAPQGGAVQIANGNFVGDDIRFINAQADEIGGGIFSNRSSIALVQVQISNCVAGIAGGGIYIEDSTITIEESIVTHNTAPDGGAMALVGTSFVSGIDANISTNTASDRGGAALVRGNITIEGVSFLSNKAASGGGIAVETGSLVLVDCIVANNTAQTSGGGLTLTGTIILSATGTSVESNDAGDIGGGLYIFGNVNVIFVLTSASLSTIVGNTAPVGAGMYIINSQADLQGIIIENGSASDAGGGIAIIDSIVEWSNVSIRANEAQNGGGVMARDAHVSCNGSVLITENHAVDGGAIWVNASTIAGVEGLNCLSNTASRYGGGLFVVETASLENVKLDANQAPNGGGVYVIGATIILAGVNISECSATIAGGGMLTIDSHVTASEVNLSFDSAPDGGGVYAIASTLSGDMMIDSCSGTDRGGGIYLTSESNVVGVSVGNCTAREGGAVYVIDGSVHMENTQLTASFALQRGGGLYVANSSVQLEDTYLGEDHSEIGGGGAFLEDSTIMHRNISVVSCYASEGGGVYLEKSAFVAISTSSQSQITGNQALDAGGNVFLSNNCLIEQLNITSGGADSGGGIAVSSGTATIRNCSAVNNAAAFGGGIDVKSGSVCVLIDSIIAMNTADETGGGIAIADATLLHDGMSVISNTAPLGAGMFATGDIQLIKRYEGSPQAWFQANNATDSASTKGYGGSLYIAPASSVNASGLDILDGGAYRGAGVYVDGGTLRLTSTFIQNCSASSGGGMYANYDSSLELRNCTLQANFASQSGGAIGSSGSQPGLLNALVLEDCYLFNNSAHVYGGAIMLALTDLSGTDNMLVANSALVGAGGAIALLSKGMVTLDNWELHNNTLGDEFFVQGGSIYLTGGAQVNISNSLLISNEKATLVRNGGIIYVEDAATILTITTTLLQFGQSYSGGLIYSVDSTVYIFNCTLHRGYAYDFGAGIFAINSRFEITNSVFYDNFAFYDGGGMFAKDGGEIVIRNCLFDHNAVEARGGAIAINPGAAVSCLVLDSNFTRNTNIGFGSTVFVGRANTVQLKNCKISGNGGSTTEGGALHAVDAAVSIENSVFELNYAIVGAAIQVTRETNLTVKNSIIRNNSASVQGGAFHSSVRAVATFTDSLIEANNASEGGAMYTMGSASIALTNVNLSENTAMNFGGAISMRGSSRLLIKGSDLENNVAYTGGAISVQENASLSITASNFRYNEAMDFGAAIYIDKESETERRSVNCATSTFGGNTATAGIDIYWVYYPSFTFDCDQCSTLSGSGEVAITTSAMTITPGWWPSSVTSGVSLGIEIPATSTSETTDTSSSSASTRKLTSSASSSSQDSTSALLANLSDDMSNPDAAVLWPTMVVRDYYGTIAHYDNATRCRASVASDENDTFVFSPSNWILVTNGYITFTNAEVRSTSRDLPYQLNVSCSLPQETQQPPLTVDVIVERCKPGYQSINGLCVACEKGYYSLDGETCFLCPAGATCEQLDSSRVPIGVSVPRRLQGFYSSGVRSSVATASCKDPSSWSDEDPCKSIAEANLTKRIHQCASLGNFGAHWSRNRIFWCLSGLEYYACDTDDACISANVTVSTASADLVDQCALGYTGVMCATCADDFYKVSSGSCKRCTDPDDPAVARMAHMLAMIPLIAVIIGIVLVCYYFSSAAEQEILKHAKAAKRFEMYRGYSRSRALLQAAKASVQRRVQVITQSVMERARLRTKRTLHLFQIQPRPRPVPGWRPEKFKIMLGFFQVFGGFKEIYEIPWPNKMSRLMDVCSMMDFNFVDATASECLFKRDYFMNYRLAVVALVGMLLLAGLLLAWGVMRYRVKLSTLPRHCVKCGLPVFSLQHRAAPTIARRATIVAKLKTDRKMRAASLHSRDLSWGGRLRTGPQRVLDRVSSSWFMVHTSRLLQYLASFTRLPASLPEHQPACPTSQRISSDVLGMVVHSNLRLWRARIWMRLYFKSFQNKCIKIFFWVLLLFYPMFSQRVLGTFYCDEIGEHYYLSLDRSIVCYEGFWLFYLPVSIAFIVVWVIGVPLLFWLILYHKRRQGVSDTLLLIQDPSQDYLKQRLLYDMRLDRDDRGLVMDEEKLQLFESEMIAQFLSDKNLNEPSTVAQVGFIYHSYNTAFWWFEVWDLGRKLCLNCVITLLAKAGASRIISGLVVLLVYLSVMLFYKPYRDRSDSALASVTHIQLFITLFCGLILKMGSLYLEDAVVSLVTDTAIVTNVATLVYAVYSILNEKVTARRMALRHTRDDHRRAIQTHVCKLWRKAFAYALTEVYLSDPDRGPMSLLVMIELVRRSKHEREMAALNAQVDLISAVEPGSPHHDAIVSASHVDVLDVDGTDGDKPGANI